MASLAPRLLARGRALLLCLALALGGPARAAVTRVPQDVSTVSLALAGASPGDSVLLSAGVYPESVVLPSGVTLRGVGPSGSVVLDAGGAGPGVTCSKGTSATRLEAVTIRGGQGGNGGGGGVRVQGGHLTLAGVRIENCEAAFGGALAIENGAVVTWSGGSAAGDRADYGGAVFADGGSLAIDGVSLSGNQAQTGGALYVQDAVPVSLVSCVIEDNVASADGGGLSFLRSGVSLSDCRLNRNRAGANGGGIAVAPGSQVVIGFSVLFANQALVGGALHAICEGPAGSGCTLVQLVHADLIRNTAGGSGAAGVAGSARVEATACVVAFNDGGIACLDPRASIDLGCTLLYANGPVPGAAGCATTMTDTTTVDPLLCDPLAGILERCADSPALSPGSCGAPFLGALGAGCPDCPTTAAIPVTWGGLKARYR